VFVAEHLNGWGPTLLAHNIFDEVVKVQLINA